MDRLKKILRGISIYLAITGTITFSLFIIEESFQTVMFSTWAAKDAKAYPVVKNSLDMMKSLQRLLSRVNNACGWINPISYLAYKAYANAEVAYINALQAELLAREPSLFIGEEVSIAFIPNECTGGYAKNNKIKVRTDICEIEEMKINGRVIKENESIIISPF